MICLLALIVFGTLGIFSATHRKIAKEALDCVLKRVTLRKCTTGLDKRLKSQLTGKLMKKSPKTARIIYKNFELISWAFTILLIWSLVQSGISLYNYSVYGNCNGKTDGEDFCLFDPAGKSKFSTAYSDYEGPVVYPDIDDDPSIGDENAPITMIEFGCFMCQYTKKAEATVAEVLEKYGDKIFYVYRDFPLSERHVGADIHSEAASCAREQGMYWEMHNLLFEKQTEMQEHDVNNMKLLAAELNLNQTEFDECMDTEKYKEEFEKDLEDGIKAGIYGTPTFFINNRTIVGPQSFEKFEKIIKEELKKVGQWT